MTGTDWLDQLEQKAAAATPGEWTTYAAYGSRGVEVAETEDMLFASTAGITYAVNEADAEFIAAANPHTVQRLINEVRRLSDIENGWKHDRSEWEAERDALATKVAAIRTVLDDAPHTDVFTLDAAIRNALGGTR